MDQWSLGSKHLAICKKNSKTFLKVVQAIALTGHLLYIYLPNTEYEIEPDDNKGWSLH